METEEEERSFINMDQYQLDQELSKLGAVIGQELGLWEELPMLELPQGEKDISKEKLAQGEERGSSQGLSQWEEDLELSVASRSEPAALEEELVPNSAPHSNGCPPSPLAGPSPALGLTEQLEEAVRGSVTAQQVPEEGVLAGELKRFQCNNEEVTELLQGDAASYEDMSQGEACSEQELAQVEACSNPDLFDWEECIDQELSLGEARSYEEHADWQECLEPWLSQAALVSSPAHSYWEEYSKRELSPRDVGSSQAMSDWEQFILQELSQDQDSIGQEMPKGNGNPPSVQSSWKDDSDQELKQDNRERDTTHSIGVKPLLQEEDKWDDVSVLELLEEPREPVLGGFAGDRLPVPFPQEPWLEPQECEPCPQVPPCASSPRVPAQALSQQLGPRKKRPSHFRRALRALRSLFRCPCLAPQPQD